MHKYPQHIYYIQQLNRSILGVALHSTLKRTALRSALIRTPEKPQSCGKRGAGPTVIGGDDWPMGAHANHSRHAGWGRAGRSVPFGMLSMNDPAGALAGMLPFDSIGLYEQPKPRFIFKMPRVVPDQKAKFESDELFRRLSRESEVGSACVISSLQ
ncbi:hypothetical protein J6590_013794 [Homalodisca vitripennis]|nr:hypothetical protein J6590_013794 [Homalodisca vitripennis]